MLGAMAPSEDEMLKLKSMVMRSLESGGVLGKLRAELRANVYKAMDQSDPTGEQLAEKGALHALSIALIMDWLDAMKCQHSLNVFCHESRAERGSRKDLCQNLGIDVGAVEKNAPVLHHILHARQNAPSTVPPKGRLAPLSTGTSVNPTNSGSSLLTPSSRTVTNSHSTARKEADSARGGSSASDTSSPRARNHEDAAPGGANRSTARNAYADSPEDSKARIGAKASSPGGFKPSVDMDMLDALSKDQPLPEKSNLAKPGFTERKEASNSSLKDLPPLGGLRGNASNTFSSTFLPGIDPVESKPSKAEKNDSSGFSATKDDVIEQDKRKAEEIQKMINDPTQWKANAAERKEREESALAKDNSSKIPIAKDTKADAIEEDDDDIIEDDFDDMSVGEQSDQYYVQQGDAMEESGVSESNAFPGPDISVDSQQLEDCDHFEMVKEL